MIRLKPLLEIQLIKEALPLDMARRFTNIDRNPEMVARQDSILDFLKQQSGAKTSRRGDRVAIPFTSDFPVTFNNPSQDLIQFYKNLEDLRERANHWIRKQSGDDGKLFPGLKNIFSVAMPTIDDQYGRKIKMSKYITALYMEGHKQIRDYIESLIVKDPATGKEVFDQKFGATISAEEARQKYRNLAKQDIEKLIQQYNKIPEVEEFRTNKPKLYYMIFSKHPIDVAGMSTNRGWTSCMNLYTGSNKRYIGNDVIEGTMVVYLVREDDLNINKPTARIAIKPYVNYQDETDVLYEPENKVYGTAPDDFKKQVDVLINQAQPDKRGTFQLVDTLYCDSKSQITKVDPKMAERAEELIAAGEQATTVDEALFMIQNYCVQSGDNQNPSLFKFYDADGLYVNSQQNITISDKLAYSPVKINFAPTFTIKQATQAALKTFPTEVNTIFLRLPNIRNFEGMPTKINNQLHIDAFRGDNFNGLQPGPRLISIGTAQSYNLESVIKSFQGIPPTVDELHLATETVLDMTIQEFIEQLKPVQLRAIRYRWNILLPTESVGGHQKLTRSMIEWMKTFPPAISKEHGEIPNSQYKRMMRQVTKQLPTIQWLFSTPVDQMFRWNGINEPEWIDTTDTTID